MGLSLLCGRVALETAYQMEPCTDPVTEDEDVRRDAKTSNVPPMKPAASSASVPLQPGDPPGEPPRGRMAREENIE